jgi:hypothetical protein
MLLDYAPGVGKTQSVLDALNSKAGSLTGPVLVISKTHDQLEHYEKHLRVPTVHVWGRPSKSLCKYPELAITMSARRLMMDGLVCKKTCDSFAGCPYYAQFENRTAVWLTTPALARSSRFANGPPPSDDEDRWFSAVTYDDVDPLEAFVDQVSVDGQDLLVAAGQNESDTGGRLLRQFALLISDVGESIRGPELIRALDRKFGTGRMRDIIDQLEEEAAAFDPEPNLPSGRMPTVDDIKRQPKRFVRELIRAFVAEGTQFLDGNDFNGSIEVTSRGVTVSWVNQPGYLPYTPTLILNAMPDIPAWSRVFRWQVTSVEENSVEMPSNVRIVQVVDAFNGKRDMSLPGHRDARIKQVERLLPTLEKPVGLITHSDNVEAFAEAIQDQELVTDHYFGAYGVGKFDDCRSLVLIGRPTPNEYSLIRRLSAFYASARPLDERVAPFFQGYNNTADRDGLYEVEVRGFADHRIESAYQARQDAELQHAFYRIRPITRDERLQIYIFTEHPVPVGHSHLTGFSKAFCPEFDPVTHAAVRAVRQCLADAGAEDRAYVGVSEVATMAFGTASKANRRKIRNPGRVREIEYHADVTARVVTVENPLRRGGVGSHKSTRFFSD